MGGAVVLTFLQKYPDAAKVVKGVTLVGPVVNVADAVRPPQAVLNAVGGTEEGENWGRVFWLRFCGVAFGGGMMWMLDSYF